MHFREVADAKRLLVLILVMVGVAVSSAGLGGWGLYRAALNEQRNWLYELVQTQARLIEAVARHDAKHSQKTHSGGASAATLSQILDAYNHSVGFGQSGEFVFGRLDGDLIVILDTGHLHGADVPSSVPFDSNIAEPMHHALQGQSGTIIGTDYRGVRVLAAFEPVAILNIGIVAKIDLDEVRAPYMRVAIMGGLGALFIVIVGGVLTHRISAPFVSDLDLQARMLKNMSEGVVLIRSQDATIVFANPKLEALFGYDPGELIGKNVSVLNAEGYASSEQTAHEIIQSLKEKGAWAGEVLNAHKDGTPFWCHASVSAFKHPKFGEVWVSVHDDISKRKALEGLASRLGRIIEQSKNEVFVFNANTLQFIQVNRGARENLGYTLDELSAMTPLDIKPEMTPHNFAEVIEPLRDGSQENITFQTIHERKDGSTYDVEVFLQYMALESPPIFVAIILDITERKKIENELVRLSHQMNLILSAAGDGIYGLDLEGRTTFSNPASAQMIGWEADELIGKIQHDILHHTKSDGSPYPREQCPIYAAIHDGKVRKVDNEVFWRKDGTSFPVEYIATPILEDGKQAGAVVVFRDITKSKQAEDALKKSEQRFRAIADYTYDWEIWLGDGGDVKWVNPAVERMTGYLVSECMAMTNFPLEIVHKDDRVAMSEHRTQALYQGMESDIEFRVRCKNTKALWAACAYQPIFDDDDVFLGSRWSIRDISARKRFERDLRQAKSDAEKANSAKSEFLAGMSHELRTPLNAIMGFSDMMRGETFGPLGDAHYDGYANDIYNSGELLISLINDILDLSKVEAGKYELVEESLQVLALVDTCIRQVEKMAQDAGLTLSVTIAPDLPKLCGDKKVVTQIINNLLSNAIKFTPVGGRVGVAAKLDEEGALVMSVSDEGIGMSPEDITRAMQPFEQVSGGDNTLKHEGTGLGLPLCANFMALHDGEIDVQSEVGQGTTVTVRFPADRTVVT